jgi:poly-gamma-glutamate synthesis protein (capsule biosynthesis protein)
MTGKSWRPGCPVGLDDLRMLEPPYIDPDGRERTGRLVVHRDVAVDVMRAFAEIRDARYPIERIRTVDHYDADDDASMLDNNTSAFNCRRVDGSSRWSEHAYGRAIDVNPFKNPWVKGDSVDPPQAARYADRSIDDPQLIHRDDAVWKAFRAIGWAWGGDWSGSKDYQHFSASGR